MIILFLSLALAGDPVKTVSITITAEVVNPVEQISLNTTANPDLIQGRKIKISKYPVDSFDNSIKDTKLNTAYPICTEYSGLSLQPNHILDCANQKVI